jgi:DNA-binding MarR family transcriptional regulator
MGDHEMREDLVRLLREFAAESERLGQAFADNHHMHPTDLNALLAVMHADQAGVPLTPGRLGHHLGLSSGATTAVIDRLERAGHVHRERDERDRRRVTLHYGDAASALGSAYFGPLGLRMDRLLAGYSGAELSVVRRFLVETNELMRHRRNDLQTAGG